jgi:hypothetical protein
MTNWIPTIAHKVRCHVAAALVSVPAVFSSAIALTRSWGTSTSRLIQIFNFVVRLARAGGPVGNAAILAPPGAEAYAWRRLSTALRRQSAEAGNGLDRTARPDPPGHDDGKQQQPDRESERVVQLPVRSMLCSLQRQTRSGSQPMKSLS